MDQLPISASAMGSSVPNAPYTRRAPSPPFIPVARPRPSASSLALQPLTIYPSFDRIDPNTLTEPELAAITNGYQPQVAQDRSATWTYAMRHEAQRITDFLYVGPRTIVKDAAWLRSEGVSMVVLAHDPGFGPMLKGFLERATEGLGIEPYLLPAVGTQDLSASFSGTVRAINQHLVRCNKQHQQSGGAAPRGKVLVSCQTGNDRATVIAAAYLMAMFGVELATALHFVTQQRFCANFDEESKRALVAWQEILRARRDVYPSAEAFAPAVEVVAVAAGGGVPNGGQSGWTPAMSVAVGSPATFTGGSSRKRRIEDTRDDDDMEMSDGMESENMDSDRYLGRNPFTPFVDVKDDMS